MSACVRCGAGTRDTQSRPMCRRCACSEPKPKPAPVVAAEVRFIAPDEVPAAIFVVVSASHGAITTTMTAFEDAAEKDRARMAADGETTTHVMRYVPAVEAKPAVAAEVPKPVAYRYDVAGYPPSWATFRIGNVQGQTETPLYDGAALAAAREDGRREGRELAFGAALAAFSAFDRFIGGRRKAHDAAKGAAK